MLQRGRQLEHHGGLAGDQASDLHNQARNGRTLADNAPEVMLPLVARAAVPSGLKPSVAKHLRDTSSRTSCQHDRTRL